MLKIVRTNSDNPEFQELNTLLNAELAIRDGADHAFYAQYNQLPGIDHILLGYVDGKPVACGALKEYAPDVMEVKRMYVRPEARGRRLAAQVLDALEAWAAELGYRTCILETGVNQPEAIALYQRQGYIRFPNYGQYTGIANSVCMRKELPSMRDALE